MSCPAHELATARAFLRLEDVDFIRDVAHSLPENPIVVDLGAGGGTTALAVFAQRDDARILTVDEAEEALSSCEAVVTNIGRRAHWVGWLADSVEAASSFDREADLIMLDTSHAYEHTVREIEAWLPKLKPGGVFWFHDYVDIGNGYGVDRAVDEAVRRGELSIMDVAGLGAACVKLPPPHEATQPVRSRRSTTSRSRTAPKRRG